MLSKFLPQIRVYVNFNITSDMYVKIYVPVSKNGTREYANYLVLDEALRYNHRIYDRVNWWDNYRVYRIDPCYFD